MLNHLAFIQSAHHFLAAIRRQDSSTIAHRQVVPGSPAKRCSQSEHSPIHPQAVRSSSDRGQISGPTRPIRAAPMQCIALPVIGKKTVNIRRVKIGEPVRNKPNGFRSRKGTDVGTADQLEDLCCRSHLVKRHDRSTNRDRWSAQRSSSPCSRAVTAVER